MFGIYLIATRALQFDLITGRAHIYMRRIDALDTRSTLSKSELYEVREVRVRSQ